MRVIIALVAGLTCVVLAVFVGQRRQMAEVSRLGDELREVQSRPTVSPRQDASRTIVLTGRERSNTVDRTSTDSPERAGSGAGDLDASSAGYREPATTPQAEQDRVDEATLRLGSEFSNESYDGTWAPEARALIDGELRKFEGGELAGVECRASLCRAQVHHPNGTGQQAFVRNLIAPPRFWQGEIEALRQPLGANGEMTTTIFFAREGRAIEPQ